MQKKTTVDTLRRIQEVGYLREIDPSQRLNTRRLDVKSNPVHSTAFKFGPGTGFFFDLLITANRRIRIMEFGNLKLGRQELDMDWWVNEEPHVYRFYRNNSFEFQWDNVLNHRLGDRGLVCPESPMDGFLVGKCSTCLPWRDLQGFPLPATLSILDGTENVHLAEVSFRFDKSLNIEFAGRRSSLFEPRSVKCSYSDRVTPWQPEPDAEHPSSFHPPGPEPAHAARQQPESLSRQTNLRKSRPT